jgi:hypothetical protein
MSTDEKRQKRKHASREEWRDRVERWKASGLRGKEFAAKEELSPRSLSWWRWQLHRSETAASVQPKQRREARRKATSDKLSFVPVVVGKAKVETGPSFIEIVLPNDLRLRVAVEIDETALVRVVRALGAA